MSETTKQLRALTPALLDELVGSAQALDAAAEARSVAAQEESRLEEIERFGRMLAERGIMAANGIEKGNDYGDRPFVRFGYEGHEYLLIMRPYGEVAISRFCEPCDRTVLHETVRDIGDLGAALYSGSQHKCPERPAEPVPAKPRAEIQHGFVKVGRAWVNPMQVRAVAEAEAINGKAWVMTGGGDSYLSEHTPDAIISALDRARAYWLPSQGE